MNNTFEFIGKIMPCKETESFKPYGTTQFPNSVWGKKQIKFNVVCGTNRHTVEVTGLINVNNPASQKIYTTRKIDNNGDVKYENMIVDYKDRFDEDIVSQVASFKKYVVDTEISGRRADLETAVEKFADGTITDEQIAYLGISGYEDCKAALEKSRSRRKEFISELDYIDSVNAVVNDPDVANMIFRVTGLIEFEYNEDKDIWYRKFNVHRIIRVKPDTEQKSVGTFDLFFDKKAVDDSDYDQTKKIHISAYVPQYLGKYKSTFFCPITVNISGMGDETAEKKAKVWAKKFKFPAETDAAYREFGVTVDLLNGAQKVELTEDMLTDEQKENIEFGLCTMEDIVREMGGTVYGDRVSDTIIIGIAKGFSGGARDTAYTSNDFCKPHNEIDDDADDDMDIFDDDI